MTNFIKSGDNLTLAAPYDVLSGGGFKVGNVFGVAANDALSGADVECNVEGVYIETRQGFEVDGVEIKARLDFAAAAIDHRGLQKNTAA